MPRCHRTVSVTHRQGLHARPAAVFVQVAKRFAARVTVKKGRKIVDGKSIMGVLTLAANPGAHIAIITDGTDAVEALEQLSRVLTEPIPAPTATRTRAGHTISKSARSEK